MSKKPWEWRHCTTTTMYVPMEYRGRCWYPLPEHYHEKTLDGAKKKLERYLQINANIDKQHPGYMAPIKATRIAKCTTVTHTIYEEVIE